MCGILRFGQLNARSFGRTSIGLFLIAAALFSLTGCQLLGNQQTQVNDSVVLGSATMDFGKVGLGNSKSIPNQLTNFKTTSVTIVSIAGQDATVQVSGITLPLTLTPGQVAQFSVVFQPSAPGTLSKTLSFGDNSQFLANLDVAGEGVQPGQLNLSPSVVNFGNIKVGTNNTSTVTMSNGGATDVSISQASLSGASFTMSNLSLPLTLHPGGTASFSVTFAPTGVGNFSGSISFTTVISGQNRHNGVRGAQRSGTDTSTVLALNGVGVAAGTLSANPASIAFGSVQVGSNTSTPETLTNTGGSPLSISQATVTGTGFSIAGLSLPTTLAPNQSVAFTVKFAPTVAGAASGNLTIASDGSNPSLSIPLSGTGNAAGQLSANPASLAFVNVQIA